MSTTFEADGKVWRTDAETLALMTQYRRDGSEEMVGMVFTLGQKFRRIVEAE
jgi:hypothetical protein